MVKYIELQILFFTILVMLKARLFGVPKTLKNLPLKWLPFKKSKEQDDEGFILSIKKDIDAFFNRKIIKSSFYKKQRCLAKSLNLAWYAQKSGIEITLHFGVKKKSEDLKGHCWITSPMFYIGEETGGKDFIEMWRHRTEYV